MSTSCFLFDFSASPSSWVQYRKLSAVFPTRSIFPVDLDTRQDCPDILMLRHIDRSPVSLCSPPLLFFVSIFKGIHRCDKFNSFFKEFSCRESLG